MSVRLPVTVTVEILGVDVVLNQTNVEFEAVTPEVNRINQLDGSGLFTNGTEITIYGSYLYAGEVSVQFEDTHASCIITAVLKEEITCRILFNDTRILHGDVALNVILDGHTIGVGFLYAIKTEFTSVSPQYTIPVGGTKLLFKGTGFYLEENQVARIVVPRSVLTGGEIFVGNCRVQNSTALECTTPKRGSLGGCNNAGLVSQKGAGEQKPIFLVLGTILSAPALAVSRTDASTSVECICRARALCSETWDRRCTIRY